MLDNTHVSVKLHNFMQYSTSLQLIYQVSSVIWWDYADIDPTLPNHHLVHILKHLYKAS